MLDITNITREYFTIKIYRNGKIDESSAVYWGNRQKNSTVNWTNDEKHAIKYKNEDEACEMAAKIRDNNPKTITKVVRHVITERITETHAYLIKNK